MFSTRQILSLGCVTSSMLLAGAGFYISAQQTSVNRVVHVVVTIPGNGKLLTGLAQENFEIVENGNVRAITSFDAASPVSIAIVGVAPPDIAGLKGPQDELILTPSLPYAVRELAASKNARKALILTVAADPQGVPDGIQVLKADAGDLTRTMIDIHNEYVLGFSASAQSSAVDVTLKQVGHLPPLRLTQK